MIEQYNFQMRRQPTRIAIFLAALHIASVSWMIAEIPPGTIQLTHRISDDTTLVQVTVPQRFLGRIRGWSDDRSKLRVPSGWTVNVFYGGPELNKARFLAWGPDSTLYVANMSAKNILALPDRDGDGVADTVITALSEGLEYAHDIRFYRDTLFVCQERGVLKCWSTNKDHRYDRRITLIDKSGNPDQLGGNHRTRTLGLDTVNMKIYVSIGSRENATRESSRAIIERYDWDGTNSVVYATGVRNAVGMEVHPRTGRLWANNNGADHAGDDLPPEWLDIIRESGFYGHPYAAHHQYILDLTRNSTYQALLPLTSTDSALIRSMVPAAATVTAHSAPMAIAFPPLSFREPYRYGAFMVLRGSWNRFPATGAKIVFVQFPSDADSVATVVRDVITGFTIDSMARPQPLRWGRPVGIALSHKSEIYFTSDDVTHVILRAAPPKSTSVQSNNFGALEYTKPSPASDYAIVELPPNMASASHLSYEITDVSGRSLVARSIDMPAFQLHLPLNSIPTGIYSLRVVSAEGSVYTIPLSVVR